MTCNRARALELLRAGTGIADVAFRADQEEAIHHVVEGVGRLLVVQRTGWGKSFVYFIATKLLREAGHGPVLLVSPLLALMRNQIAAAERMGVRAATINSDNEADWDVIADALRDDAIDILLISPERLGNPKFRSNVLPDFAARVPLLVVDEAHCISDWGHDFRPHYRLIRRLIEDLPRNLRLLATTATASRRVMDDLSEVLGPGLTVMRGPLGRPSLALQTLRMPSAAERMAWLAERIPSLGGTGIVYVLTVRDAERIAAWLRSRDISAESYTGETGDRREEIERKLLANEIKVVVATSALGMGFDKPDLGFVIHYQMPGSVVAYYQQVGRAGRALACAPAVLLAGEEDGEILDYFVRSAFPTREEAQSVIDALAQAHNGLSLPELQELVNLRRGRLDHALRLLSLESPAPIAKQGPKWMLTPSPLPHSFWERVDRLAALREAEIEQMRQYVDVTDGHMAFLIRALDGKPEGPHAAPTAPIGRGVSLELANEAVAFLRRRALPIEPRKQWATELPSHGLRKGRIALGDRAEAGLALSVYLDPGWGTLVKQGKYPSAGRGDARFDDRLVDAAVDAIREWSPSPAPRTVTCVTSVRHPTLVPDFASRLAGRLGLPFIMALREVDTRPAQKSMQNSAHQLLNLDGRYRVDDGQVPALSAGPILLVDDIVDARWTFTVCAALLRRAGCPTVYPFALAESTPTDD